MDLLAVPAWRACFELAWEAFAERSIPVGAVLVDPAGTTVATGRNRYRPGTAPPGQISGSAIAHAEVNALAAVPPGEYGDHTLYSTLEPCPMCTSALRFSHIGTVRYAGEDALWYNLEQLAEINHHIGRRWTRRDGPVDGPLRALAIVLHLISAVERGIRSVQEAHEQSIPDVAALARRLAGARADHLRTITLDEALAELEPELAAITPQPARP